MQALFPPTTEELTRAQDRLATAKDADDQEQAALRVAKANATAAKKELAAALRGWRAILRQANGEPDAEDADEPEKAEDDEADDDETGDQADDEPVPSRPVGAGAAAGKRSHEQDQHCRAGVRGLR